MRQGNQAVNLAVAAAAPYAPEQPVDPRDCDKYIKLKQMINKARLQFEAADYAEHLAHKSKMVALSTLKGLEVELELLKDELDLDEEQRSSRITPKHFLNLKDI